MTKMASLIKILGQETGYDPQSYSFVMAALHFTRKKLNRAGHVTGEELLDGIKDYTLEEFGPMSRTVLEYWGIKTTGDFGEIVFNMIDAGLLTRTDKDSKKDFQNRYDFKEAFDKGHKYFLH